MRRKDRPQTREARMLFEVRARVAQRAGDVLDVHRVAADRGLIAERAERFQVPLQRHQIEPATKGAGVCDAFEREEICDQIVEIAIRDVDV